MNGFDNLLDNNDVGFGTPTVETLLESRTSQNNDIGVGEVFDISFLFIVTLVGTCGNLLVIFSIIFDKSVQQHGNLFIINLAVTDLLVGNLNNW